MPPRVKSPAPQSRDEKIEKWLKSLGHNFEFRTGIALSEFDEERSLHNQARVAKPIDEATVEKYMVAMADGATFPAIIAAETSATDPLFVADGNHRFQAHKRNGATEIDAYVVVGASYAAITLLTFLANADHGLPTTDADRMEQAKHLVDSGASVEKAARLLHLPTAKLRAVTNLADLGRRAKEVGLNMLEWERLPASVRTTLGRISTDEGFTAMAKLTIDAGLRAESVGEAVEHLKTLRSSGTQTDYVAALRKTFARDLQVAGTNLNGVEKARVGAGQNPRTKLGMRLGGLKAIGKPEEIAEALHREERHEWIERVDEAMNWLNALKAALAEK